MKIIKCTCGMEIAPCGMHTHLRSNVHFAAQNRMVAQKNNPGMRIYRITDRRHIKWYEKLGWEIVVQAFWHRGGIGLVGYFTDGVVISPQVDVEKVMREKMRENRKEYQRKYQRQHRAEKRRNKCLDLE